MEGARRQIHRENNRVKDREVPEKKQDRHPGDQMSLPLTKGCAETSACALHRKMSGRLPRPIPAQLVQRNDSGKERICVAGGPEERASALTSDKGQGESRATGGCASP